MKYKLKYRMVRKHAPQNGEKFLFSETVDNTEISLFSEEVDLENLLNRMKEIEKEHKTNVEGIRALPQFVHFLPIENFF